MAKDYKDLSDLLKHCTVAIYKSGKVHGSDKEKFQGAWKIARAHLTRYGYLAPGSEEGPVDKIKFTHKGAGKTTKHTQEGRAKSKLFDQKSYLLLEIDSPPKSEDTQPGPDQTLDQAEKPAHKTAPISFEATERAIVRQRKLEKKKTSGKSKPTKTRTPKIKKARVRRAKKA